MWVGTASTGVPGGKSAACGVSTTRCSSLWMPRVGLGDVEQGHAGARRVGGDGLVAEVEAEPPRPRPADHAGRAGPPRGRTGGRGNWSRSWRRGACTSRASTRPRARPGRHGSGTSASLPGPAAAPAGRAPRADRGAQRRLDPGGRRAATGLEVGVLDMPVVGGSPSVPGSAVVTINEASATASSRGRSRSVPCRPPGRSARGAADPGPASRRRAPRASPGWSTGPGTSSPDRPGPAGRAARCSARPAGYARRTSVPPAAATISASAIVAHLCLRIPIASPIRTIAGILCVLTCGRSRSARPGHRDHRLEVLRTSPR